MSACAASSHSPREYLDTRTAATITVAGEPWVFARERPELAVNVRDYVSLHAVEVNRSGARATYLLAHVWTTLSAPGGPAEAPPVLAIAADDRLFLLQPATESLRSLGLGDEIVHRRGRSDRVWCYPLQREAVEWLSEAHAVTLELRSGPAAAAYSSWRAARSPYRLFIHRQPRP